MEKEIPTVINAIALPEQGPQENISSFRRIFHGTLVQVFIVGLVSCMNPGIWNALNSTSAMVTYFSLSLA